MPERVALVTGGSRGIGRAICEVLAPSYAIAVNYRSDAEAAKETLAHIESLGGEGLMVQGDVTDPDRVAAMFDEVEEAFGFVSILVNNAGIRRDKLMLRMTDADWHDVLSVNLYGAFACSRRALGPMIRERFGRIVNIASVAGIKGNPGQVNYCAAKAGLIGITKALAREVARKNVTVNAVAPGLVETELTTSLPTERYAEIVGEVPARRAALPAEVGSLVGFLCSEQAAYINGAVLTMDGAMTA